MFKLKDDRVLPSNTEAEEALLGAILLNNELFEKVAEFLLPEHFSNAVNKKIFEGIAQLINLGSVADPITLQKYFQDDKTEVDKNYLISLAESVIGIERVYDYGKIIYDLYLRRKLIGIGEGIVEEAYSFDVSELASTQIEKAEKKLFDLSENRISNSLVTFGQAMVSAIENAELAYNNDSHISGITTGFLDIDRMLGGFHRSDLIIIAGRPSMGKTALATNIAFNAASSCMLEKNSGGVVAFFSLEMSSEQLATRILAQESKISSEKIRRGEIKKDELAGFIDVGRRLNPLPLYIDDTPAISTSVLRSKARKIKRQFGLDMIIVDYLQLLQNPGYTKLENRVLEISNITRDLKAIAKEFNVPVVALSQLSRAVEQRDDKRPHLADLRESGSIEQDADVVLFIFREEYYLSRSQPEEGTDKHRLWLEKISKVYNLAELIVAKQRHGSIGTIKLFFDSNVTRFSNYAKQD